MSGFGNQPFKKALGKKIETIAILTGGGDCPGLNAVIRSVTKSATLNHKWKVIGILDGFEGLVHKRTAELTYDSVKGIIALGGTILGTSNKCDPFNYKTKNGESIVTENLSGKVIENISKLKIDALVAIGGDGTLKIANEFSKMGVPLVGIPKTIDNDLSATDQTFGFDSAVNTAVEAIDKIRTTAESHHRVMIVEVMGRNTGWIALYSGLASGADVILIPEIPYKIENLITVIKERMAKKRNSSIIVVAEGAKPSGGHEVVKMFVKDSADEIRLGGISDKIAKEISETLKVEVRATILGHIQRGGVPTSLDRVLASRLGTEAVELISVGSFGKMAALKGSTVTSVQIEAAIGSLKRVSPEGEIANCALSLGVSFGN